MRSTPQPIFKRLVVQRHTSRLIPLGPLILAFTQLGTVLCCSLLFVLFSSVLFSSAAAQSLRLSEAEPVAGERVSVTGRGFSPGGQVTAQLTAPGGRVTRESAQVGDDGRLSLALTLPTGGRYQLVVRGQGLERTWQLSVPRPIQTPAASEGSPPSPQAGSPRISGQTRGQTEDQINDETRGQASGQSLTPEPDPLETAALRVTRNDDGVSAVQGDNMLWKLTFPRGSGATTQPLLQRRSERTRLFLGHGNSVLELSPQTGAVLARFLVSGPVIHLESIGTAVGITVRHSDTLLERFTLQNGALQEPVSFGTDPRTFSYLRAEAGVLDPAARLRRDPTNPWLYLKLGQQQDPEIARSTYRRAIGAATTFYDLAGLAVVLENRGERILAENAFDKALRDFAVRGYDPRLLTDGVLEAAYNFPLEPLQAALEQNDDLSAEFWAERLRLTAPQVPGAAAAFTAYAALLRQLGILDEADLWAGRAAPKPMPGGGLERLGLTLARSGWQLVPALLDAFFALHLTLLARYARARRSDHVGGRLPWLFALRYDTLGEKLVLLSLLALTLVFATLGSWADRDDLPTRLTGSGTLTNRAAQAYLAEPTLTGPRAAFLRGTAQVVADRTVAGETEVAGAVAANGPEAAQQYLEAAGDYAPALNNLGVLTGDETLFRRALELEPNLPAARYNTGDTALLPFQEAYRPGSPALALPTPDDLQFASGSPREALAEVFTNPQRALSRLSTPPYGLSLVLWRVLQLLFLLVAFVHSVFLFVPRPRSAHGAPRGPVYHLLALLFPGTGLADELWGIFLLVPWAIFGAAAVSPFGLQAASPLTLYFTLAGIYLINTVAVIVESFSHRSQRRGPSLRRSAVR